MSASLDKLREDFDRIARLTEHRPTHPSLYDDFLLQLIPSSLVSVLEVGCGTGAFSRNLVNRGHRVTGIDLSPEMIRVARERCVTSQQVTFVCADFMRESFGNEAYDCVVSIATLHHMHLEPAVRRMAGLVRPGGLLVVHDLRADAGMWDRLRSGLGVAARAWTRVQAGQLWEREEVRAAWAQHGRGERYLAMPEVDGWARTLLPGSIAFRHLQWRYTVLWRRDYEDMH